MTKRDLLALIAYLERRAREELECCYHCGAHVRTPKDHEADCPIAKALRDG